MTQITLETLIKAPSTNVFNLSLDIDFHKKSASRTQEEAIAGITSGQIRMGENVTWRGKHFGLWLTHTSVISQYKAPSYCVDEMTAGKFKSFRHEHRFRESGNFTIMADVISYEVPYGIVGAIFNNLILKKHLTKFIITRNLAIKNTLESQNLL